MGGGGVTGVYSSDAWEGVVACVAIRERHLQLVAGTSLYTCNMQWECMCVGEYIHTYVHTYIYCTFLFT